MRAFTCLIIPTVLFSLYRQTSLPNGADMTLQLLARALGTVPGCGTRFYLPAEDDGPGTMEIFEFRCVLRQGHRGSHRIEEAR